MGKLKFATVWLGGCSGCHMSFLDLDEWLIDLAGLERQIEARDRELDNSFGKDAQVMAIHNARRSLGDRIVRTAASALTGSCHQWGS